MEAFRCIQVSRLLLDHQLPINGTFAPAVGKIIADASFIAWERVVEESLHHDVHCVLISGDCVEPHYSGLRGPAALVRGICRLAENEIAVVLHSSPRIWENWPAGLRWPAYAHRLGGEFETEAPISQDGRHLATITAYGNDEHRPHWQIRLAGADVDDAVYSLPNNVGFAQGIDRAEPGPHGPMLYEFRRGEELQQTQLSTAPVCWQRCSVRLSPDATRDDALQELACQIDAMAPAPGEQVRLITWEISGEGELIRNLSHFKYREEFLIDLELLDRHPGITVQTHEFRLSSQERWQRPVSPADDLHAEFAVRLEERLADHVALHQERLAGAARFGNYWDHSIERLLGDPTAGDLADEARLLAARWFSTDEEDVSR